MKVNVQTPNFVADQKLVDFITNRLLKLELFHDQIIFADVFLKVQKTSEKENKAVEILLNVPGGELIVKKETKTFEEGADECVKALERQLKKRKQKQRSF